MNIVITKTYEESCKYVAEKMVQLVNKNPEAKLGLATGGTAEKVYPHLVSAHQKGRVNFSKISTVNLDEYMGMSPDHEASYRRCMDSWFFDHVNIDKERTYVPDGLNNSADEIKIFNERLYGDKLLDFQLLGVGVSGHIGFNEPSDRLIAGVHIEQLDEKTIKSNARFFESEADVPRTSITMGVGDIMKAGKIILIATGDNKIPVMTKLLADDAVSTDLPVSVLKMHPDVTIVMDANLANQCDRNSWNKTFSVVELKDSEEPKVG